MKKRTLFPLFFLCLFLGAQKIQPIKFYTGIKDRTKTVHSLELIDARNTQNLGKVNFKNEEYTFAFDQDTAEKQFEDWFLESNKKNTGTRDLVILLEKFTFFSEELNKKSDLEKINIKMSVFEKKFGNYYFLDRINDVILLDPQRAENTPKGFVRYLDGKLSTFIKNTYEIEKNENNEIKEADLNNYEAILRQKLPLYSTATLKNGVYTDYISFASQKPLGNYELMKNSKGEIVRAKFGEDRIPLSKMYTFVDNGIAYIPTIAGNLELKKDEKGFYVYSNRKSIFPEEINTIYYSFGIVGGIAGAINASVKHDKAMKSDKYNIYIDSLNGNFIFEE